MAEALPPVVDDEGSENARAGDRGDVSLAEALGEVAPLSVAGSGLQESGSLIQVEAGRAGDDEVGASSLHEIELAVLGGYIDVRAIDDDLVAIRDLVIDIDDIELPAGLVSADIEFTGVQARIAHPETVDIAWEAGGERAESVVAIDLVVEWGVSIDGGEMHPLAPVHIESLEVILELSKRDNGAVGAQLAGFREGVFYEWGGVVELRGLAMDLRAWEGTR